MRFTFNRGVSATGDVLDGEVVHLRLQLRLAQALCLPMLLGAHRTVVAVPVVLGAQIKIRASQF